MVPKLSTQLLSTRLLSARLLSGLTLVALLVALCLPLRSQAQPIAPAGQQNVDFVIYADALASGWQDWSWGGITDRNGSTVVYQGAKAYAITASQPWAGFSLRAPEPIATYGYTALAFWIHGGSSTTGLSLYIQQSDSASESTRVDVDAAVDTWTQVQIPLSALGNPMTIARITLQDRWGAIQPTYYVDDLLLIGDPFAATPTPTPTLAPDVDVQLSIDVAAARKPISDDIYGIHYVEDEAFAQAIDLPLRRWGGNDTTRYNWQNNMYGNPDWYFENERRTTSADDFIVQNQGTGAASIITIPMIGYVARDPGEVGNSATYPCSFDTRKYSYTPQPYPYNRLPATDPADPNRAHCGSGIVGYQNGEQDRPLYFTGNDPLDTSIAITTAWATTWIAHLHQQFGTAANGGIRFYSLDNEPDLWFETHRDVAPVALTLAQLRDQSYAYAAAIKAADPDALTLGPVVHGWTYYWHSPSDGQAGLWATRPDRQQYNDMPLAPWYLQQMAVYEAVHGVRLLDYFDLHYYVAAPGVSQQDAGDAGTQARRLRSTRSLWDPTYVDESWISSAPVTDGNQIVPDYKVVRLLPRMREWRDQYYPGTKLAITEYNWGALDHINGALAQADVLGIFGREGLDLAVLFDSPYAAGGKFTVTGPGAFAFRLYRNYDGQGSKFGDTSVHATSSDQNQLAIYAAQRGSDHAVTAVVINKTAGSLTANLAVANFPLANQAQVYQYSAENLTAIQTQPDLATTTNGLVATFPANSITLLQIAQGVNPGPTPTLTTTPSPVPTSATATPIAGGAQHLYLPLVTRR